MNFILLAAGYPPVSIPTELRQQYCSALEAADSGDFPTWQSFLTQLLDQELDQWLSALAETQDLKTQDTRLEDTRKDLAFHPLPDAP